MKLVVLALVGALSGCGSKHADPAQACADAAKQGVDAMINQARGRLAGAQLPDDVRARMMERQKRLEGAGGKMRAVFTNRCVEDKWSNAVLACYRKVTSLEEMRACRRQLTPEQQAKLQKDELEMLAGVSSPDQAQSGVLAPMVDPRITMINNAINDAMKQVADAKTDAERESAKTQLETLQAEKMKIEAEVEQSKTPGRP